MPKAASSTGPLQATSTGAFVHVNVRNASLSSCFSFGVCFVFGLFVSVLGKRLFGSMFCLLCFWGVFARARHVCARHLSHSQRNLPLAGDNVSSLAFCATRLHLGGKRNERIQKGMVRKQGATNTPLANGRMSIMINYHFFILTQPR